MVFSGVWQGFDLVREQMSRVAPTFFFWPCFLDRKAAWLVVGQASGNCFETAKRKWV
jgi:hypothetical protein